MFEGHMWEIVGVVGIAVFSITCFFFIRTLIAAERALKKVEQLCEEATPLLKTTDNRLESLDSLFRTISNLGDIGEIKTQELKHYFLERQSLQKEDPPLGEELAKWALSTLSIYRKFLKKGS